MAALAQLRQRRGHPQRQASRHAASHDAPAGQQAGQEPQGPGSNHFLWRAGDDQRELLGARLEAVRLRHLRTTRGGARDESMKLLGIVWMAASLLPAQEAKRPWITGVAHIAVYAADFEKSRA